jgi:starch synthase (maltosyl-transferring)
VPKLTSYLRELAGPDAACMRPNFFANTPDILNEYLQHGGPPAFKSRAVLAATLSPPGVSTPGTNCARTSPSGRAVRST